MPAQVARLRMAQAVGSQFDTTVVAAFEAILAQATESYRVGIGPDFVFETLAEREIATYPTSGQDLPLPKLRVQVS